MFTLGEKKNITKFVNAASYLELAPFKAAIMKLKGHGDERTGLLKGIEENPLYRHDDNIQTIMLDDCHCHKTQLAGGNSFDLYPQIQYFDFDRYAPNIPHNTRQLLKRG